MDKHQRARTERTDTDLLSDRQFVMKIFFVVNRYVRRVINCTKGKGIQLGNDSSCCCYKETFGVF